MPFLALKVREWQRQIEDAGIWEPEDAGRIISAVFSPAPELIEPSLMEYALSIMTGTQAAPEARSMSIAAALGPAAR